MFAVEEQRGAEEMPSTVLDLLGAAGFKAEGYVSWRQRVAVAGPGVYMVVLTSKSDSMEGALKKCPLSMEAVEEILEVRPELRMDGERPEPADLAERISSFWLPDEVVLYIGLAGTSLANRVNQYYRTPLGARRPHAGGYFLKFLSILSDLYVHYVSTSDPRGVEDRLIDTFCSNVSDKTKKLLRDSAHPFPFANLEWPAGTRKSHGLTGTREAGARRQQTMESPARATGTAASFFDGRVKGSSSLVTQRVTPADIRVGQIRIPRGATKRALPQERGRIRVDLRGRELVVNYNPKFDPPPERSGVLGIGKAVLPQLVRPDEVLIVSIAADGTVMLK